MTTAQPIDPAADEDIRLETCALEPIHLPGAIQPHGALLVVDSTSLEIIQASENTAEVLGVIAPQLLGTGIGDLLGPDFEVTLRAGLSTGIASIPNPFQARLHGRDFDVIGRRVDDVALVEFEPTSAYSSGRDYLALLHAALARLAATTDSAELRRVAAHEIRELTGFDQVMVYHFHPDDHGEVVADDHLEGMTDYLGLHFPASDIPAQARRLYLMKGSGLIARTDYQPAALLPVINPRTGGPVDLSTSELRSVSPYHLQFMRNMGQGASFTLSIKLDGQLLGLITCAHRSPRRIPFLLRRACEILAQQVALQLGANTRAAVLTRRLEAQYVREWLAEQMGADLDVAAGLTEGTVTLLDLIQADGATVCLHHRLSSIGRTPSYSQTMALLAALTEGHTDVTPVLTEALALDRPELAALLPTIAGVFVLPFGNAGDCLIWFRREICQTVDWLGAQSADNRATALSPRTSFDAWRQTVTGRSAAWEEIHIAEATELVRDIDQVLLRLAEAQMAHMALHDALTGLPNRRLLVERITTALDRADRHGGEVAILFCDLDDFKRVNDTAGHAAGDAVLIEAAARLTSVLRAGDSVARVGGDEFVIVLEPVGDGDSARRVAAGQRDPATKIAERIKAELSRPIRYQDHEHVISVSVGITFAAPGGVAEDALRDADAAMYRAKQSGKNRVATFDDSLRAGIFERATAERSLHAALDRGGPGHPQLTVSYQPVIELDSGRLVGFEALPQLTDSAGEPIRHEVFTYVAEHTPLTVPLGERVLDIALEGLVGWQSEHPGAHRVRMSVTMSARQAQQADMPAVVRSVLDRHGLNPSDLVLELTESVLIEAGSSTLRQLTQLRDSGVGIAIDDFGTGHAGLSHLALLPIDAIKIDRSFVEGLPGDTVNAKIVRAMAGLAADLGLTCLFAGIDRDEQLACLPPGVFAQGSVLGRMSTRPLNEMLPVDALTPSP